MSSCGQLKALIKKNVILMKRSCCATICEIFFPIVLMILLVMIRRAVKIEEVTLKPEDEENFFLDNSAAFVSSSANITKWNELKVYQPFNICKRRKTIGLIDSKPFEEKIKNEIKNFDRTLSFQNFESIQDFNNYISSVEYDSVPTNPKICFGVHLNENLGNFSYSLHYFDHRLNGAIKDIPNNLVKTLDFFQTTPNIADFNLWISSGYINMMKIINDIILKSVSRNNTGSIDFAILPYRYTSYYNDRFGQLISGLAPFFLIIAYILPLCLLVFRMVKEKESRAKEGMKIMGLNESIYFFSFFIQYLVMNTLYAVLNSMILTRLFSFIGFIYIFAFFWLFGMTVFSLGYFLQSLMDRTRIAMIMSILIYFIMYFVSVAVLNEDVGNSAKMLISLLPPTCLQLGVQVLSKFESSRIKFDRSYINFSFNNYSVGNMYGMFFLDFFIYMFLGYYFQNVISQQYGTKRPYYFLCTKSYWCKKKKTINKDIDLNVIDQVVKINVSGTLNKDNFQDEKNYEDKIKRGDFLNIKELKKVYDDGKLAVDGLNLTLYKDEIYALLGHNGAGKSTTISILCGLYEATSGKAYYNGENIFDNMTEFRKKVGICPQHDVLFDNLNVREHLEMFCIFKGVPSDKIKHEVETIINEMGLNDKINVISKSLSGGMKRKLSIAIALVGGSEVVFLDEPSSGMDITSRRNLWDILKRCTNNRIIVLTTHYMEEAEVLGNRIGILSSGKLKCCGNSLFLIDRYGKYISLSVMKNKNANDDEIISFIKSKIPDIKEPEQLSEEIIFRIPINGNYKCKELFNEFDKNLDNLNIKSYGASMPTLEDVFLNVSAEVDKALKDDNSCDIDDPDSYDKYDSRNEPSLGFCKKFFIDLKSCLIRRTLQIIRDKKSFVLEVICPILLVLIGLAVSSVQFIKDSPYTEVGLNLLDSQKDVYINKEDKILSSDDLINYKVLDKFNDPKKSLIRNIFDFNNEITPTTNLIPEIKSFGSYYVIKSDSRDNKFEFITFVNTQSKDSPLIYSQNLLTNIISIAAGKRININFTNYPIPLTSRIKNQGETRNNSNLVFFVSVAFSLIPANFITILIKEREQNTKHIQIVSGISLTSYWTSNFIFELLKYYFTGGISILVILAFDNFPEYLWLLYLLYGFSMVAFTYTLTLLFKNESTAQNFVILINFIFGALGGSVILILRIFDDLKKIATSIAYIMRVIPSFSFSYGYNQLLNKMLLFAVDGYKTNEIMSFDYVAIDIIYLCITFAFYVILLIISEFFSHKVQIGNKDNKPEYEKILDTDVKHEIEKSNLDTISLKSNEQLSIRVKNLEKLYSTSCFGKPFKAIDKLSFCLEYGECFALLGVNGAGKTTTFKCLTNELSPTKGKIFVNGLDLSSNFNNVRSLIGYCPQFDAIFEYLTVKENLEFYANIRGIPNNKTQSIITSLMKELNLLQFKDKISGNLSGGNKRKLSVGISMIGNPPIILLDEPSNGMDPEARRFMWAVIHKISKTRKMSSVILTTHSMEEAETLCRRMGIMVAGQFKCLGTSQQIKEKYGYGYELSIRIMNIPDDVLRNYSSLDMNENVSLENIGIILGNVNKPKFLNLISPNNLGKEIVEEIQNRKSYSVKKLINWTFYIQNILKCISKLLNHFDEVIISEFWENNFKLKIKKNKNAPVTIGYLFGLLEDQKKIHYVSEYSISQTSMEQIFNNFARGSEETLKKEISINKNYLNQLDLMENKD